MIQITESELLEVMDGHLPPEDLQQLAAYVAIAEKRIAARYPEENTRLLGLLAGTAPEFYWEAKRKLMDYSKRGIFEL